MHKSNEANALSLILHRTQHTHTHTQHGKWQIYCRYGDAANFLSEKYENDSEANAIFYEN